jgi:hypothetical protein
VRGEKSASLISSLVVFWVLSARGEALESINTAVLENGRDSYGKDAFLAFVESYSAR